MSDEDLPDDTYPPAVFDAKVQLVYDHILAAYGDDGTSAYDERTSTAGAASTFPDGPLDVDRISDAVHARIRSDPEFAARVAFELESPERRS